MKLTAIIKQYISTAHITAFRTAAEVLPDTSSGININETSGLNLTITGGLYLHGTSYVDVYNASGYKYQTGESLSVKEITEHICSLC